MDFKKIYIRHENVHIRGGFIMQEYHNPVIKGFHPDPSICKKGKDFLFSNKFF